ncbi:hypothetical protein MNEG_1217 [Monoraphidium neglectum]|uniref:Uncharacterized protein n=1 Tax=Monoraphidium neglectum TaxID=145388 RepID=A0A0D2LK35_9CHLO|nr:hypothetical protein MNEG_1217 [Monoraphidium neglectum]KIZ06734.1 hypothetical protein MNEG_1217 [Monoraphidium neglectum]|eukprot:XP_013905753.1 hypothetical protein MNEG_1217 [Monoraphidium neglectum]
MTHGNDALLAAVGIAFLGALATGAVLQLLGRLLLDATDTVFVCWACDRDANTATRANVEEVFGAVAKKQTVPPGGVVSQPHGGYAYGQQHVGSVQVQAPVQASMYAARI